MRRLYDQLRVVCHPASKYRNLGGPKRPADTKGIRYECASASWINILAGFHKSSKGGVRVGFVPFKLDLPILRNGDLGGYIGTIGKANNR